MHATMMNVSGSVQSSLGKVFHNPHAHIKGEEKKIAAKAERDLAELHTAQKIHQHGAKMTASTLGKHRH
ncbi:hypothetical protein HKX48_003167 [Thoreauomyces humboldtii]|nr:hypothetical protein HKX48_003167 [Thoreauomyces humboldtii]